MTAPDAPRPHKPVPTATSQPLRRSRACVSYSLDPLKVGDRERLQATWQRSIRHQQGIRRPHGLRLSRRRDRYRPERRRLRGWGDPRVWPHEVADERPRTDTAGARCADGILADDALRHGGRCGRDGQAGGQRQTDPCVHIRHICTARPASNRHPRAVRCCAARPGGDPAVLRPSDACIPGARPCRRKRAWRSGSPRRGPGGCSLNAFAAWTMGSRSATVGAPMLHGQAAAGTSR